MADYKFLQYETHDDGAIVRILLDRPEARNAQNRGLQGVNPEIPSNCLMVVRPFTPMRSERAQSTAQRVVRYPG